MRVPAIRCNGNDRIYTQQLYVLDDRFCIKHPEEGVLSISFDGKTVARADTSWEPPKEHARAYEIQGIVGILKGFRETFLVVIIQAQLLGHVFDHPIFVIEQVACLDFQAHRAREKLKKAMKTDDSDSSSASDSEDEDIQIPKKKMVMPTASASTPTAIPLAVNTTTIVDKETPHSPTPLSPSRRPGSPLMDRLRMSFNAPKKTPGPRISASTRTSSAEDMFANMAINEELGLDRRLVRQVNDLFGRSMFLFSPNYDITNSFQRSFEKGPSDAPLWQQVDSRFWWNEHMQIQFKEAKLDEWIIPVMQGTMQIEACEIEGCQFDFIVISRRSRERAGMRYQRRGVNEQGQVANFVETEQIIIFERDDEPHVASFVQTRGSIPLFWSQSPYSLHPVPTLDRSNEENDAAFKKHFKTQEALYGRQIAVNLTELVGREAIIGSEYRRHVEELADPNIKYVEFDFHRETKGMRFENISRLSNSLRDDLAKIAHFWEAGPETVYCRQNGVFRTNCMDCLDRTNVVQSAFARHVLNLQLMRFGITEYPDQGIKYYGDFENTFNHLWANNGDMISRMYAGTSALKGDFTRTGKRNFTGLMNDASNSLARFYINTVKDFWRQATIDYLLGYHKIEIFRHVPQSSRMSAEPGMERRWAKIRQDAIEISSEIVVADDEVRLDGWTLLSPDEPQRRRARKFEEKVVLLTAKALYVCSYNYHLEKVVQFQRIALDTVSKIQTGEYILSALTPDSRDLEQNYGMLIFYDAERELIRMNTGSMQNVLASEKESSPSPDSSDSEDIEIKTPFVAFKGVRYNVLGELADEAMQTCQQQVEAIAIRIAEESGQSKGDIVHYPIISLEQAEKTDGFMKKMGLKIKKAIWV
ncbi:SacI homology domain-domain-containing protein [Syncephalastrum racemosum]|uniref:SacI homology domain-domain-containing protein n=1 Tax=Syncephalastrum racemosum TaxID=13706 RepID=A0A1X2HJI9_SYNRA|nr:SacI homology domain-domain-containing protein [Syncephalastrum racemosum]